MNVVIPPSTTGLERTVHRSERSLDRKALGILSALYYLWTDRSTQSANVCFRI